MTPFTRNDVCPSHHLRTLNSENMANGSMGRHTHASIQKGHSPYPLGKKNCSKLVNYNWEDSTCSVCMEYPHNAVLLLCSSHDKGCRPYMCNTDFRHSNCLEKFEKASTKAALSRSPAAGLFSVNSARNCKAPKLVCPLCRGLVKGWTVVEPARAHLNTKKRTCMHDDCSFIGAFRELQKHAMAEHSSSEPGEVDLGLEQKWNRMESEREREDVMSTIRSSNPRAVFVSDFVIEGSRYEIDANNGGSFDAYMEQSENIDIRHTNPTTSHSGAMRWRSTTNFRTYAHSGQNGNDNGEIEAIQFGTSLANRLRRQGRVILGRSQRRRRRA